MAGRQAGHLRGPQVRHLADVRPGRDHGRPELHHHLPRRPDELRRLVEVRGAVQEDGPGPVRQGRHVLRQHHHVPLQDSRGTTSTTPRPACSPTSPFRADKDQGDKSDYAIFSDGPYKLQGTFDKDKGGTFVRNPNWDPATDTIRKAYPDQIVYNEGVQTEVAYQRVIADSGADKTMIPQIQAPPSVLPQIVGNPAVQEAVGHGAVAVHRLHPAEPQEQGLLEREGPRGLRGGDQP